MENMKATKPKLCFILSILQRSGTNYIYDLLNKHPMCAGPGPIWEDHFLQHTNILSNYTNTVFNSWNPTWNVKEKIASEDTLNKNFGNAITDFLKLQLNQKNLDEFEPTKDKKLEQIKILLTRTPNVLGLENFFNFFPDAFLIIIIRDGRAVVESGVKSFDWIYEDAFRRWRDGAKHIIEYINREANKKIHIVKYENLYSNVEIELNKIFDFLELPPDLYAFDSAKNLEVRGSSDIREKDGSVHWNVIKKNKGFNPLARFQHWDKQIHTRFNWIAGKEMEHFGYNLKHEDYDKGLQYFLNRILDFKWKIRSFFIRLKRNLS